VTAALLFLLGLAIGLVFGLMSTDKDWRR